jgi:hypothetical protein
MSNVDNVTTTTNNKVVVSASAAVSIGRWSNLAIIASPFLALHPNRPTDPRHALAGPVCVEDLFRGQQRSQVLQALPQGHDLIGWWSGALQGRYVVAHEFPPLLRLHALFYSQSTIREEDPQSHGGMPPFWSGNHIGASPYAAAFGSPLVT